MEDAAAAVAATNGAKLPDGTGPLRVKFADTQVEKERKQQRRIAALRYAQYEHTVGSFSSDGFSAEVPANALVEGINNSERNLSLPSALEIPGAVQFAGLARLAKAQGRAPSAEEGEDSKSEIHATAPPKDITPPKDISKDAIATKDIAGSAPATFTLASISAGESATSPGNGTSPISALSASLKSVKMTNSTPFVPAAQNGYHVQTQETGSNCNLYVKNLPAEADDLFLYRIFSPHGAISSVRAIVNDQTGKCRGYGFVRYVHSKDAIDAIQHVNGRVRGGDQMLEVSLKTPSAKDREREIQR